MSEEARQQAYEDANAQHPLPISGTAEIVDEAPPTPTDLLEQALGRAYSQRIKGMPANEVIGAIRKLIADNREVKGLAGDYRRHLAEVVRARSIGNRCGCILTEQALKDLSAALEDRASV